MIGNVIYYTYNDSVSLKGFCKRYLIEDIEEFYKFISNDFYIIRNGIKYLRFKGSDFKNIPFNPMLMFFEEDLSNLHLAREMEKKNDGLSLKRVDCWKRNI